MSGSCWGPTLLPDEWSVHFKAFRPYLQEAGVKLLLLAFCATPLTARISSFCFRTLLEFLWRAWCQTWQPPAPELPQIWLPPRSRTPFPWWCTRHASLGPFWDLFWLQNHLACLSESFCFCLQFNVSLMLFLLCYNLMFLLNCDQKYCQKYIKSKPGSDQNTWNWNFLWSKKSVSWKKYIKSKLYIK